MTGAYSGVTDSYVEVKIIPEMIAAARVEEARIRDNRRGRPVWAGSITNGKKLFEGMLGEQMVSVHLCAAKKQSYDWDLEKWAQTLEIKTKCCSDRPKRHYLCSVAAANCRQDCDLYVFVRLKYGYSKGWILGALTPEEFKAKARFLKKGEPDPTSDKGWRIVADCWNVMGCQLNPLETYASCSRS